MRGNKAGKALIGLIAIFFMAYVLKGKAEKEIYIAESVTPIPTRNKGLYEKYITRT